MKRRLCALLFCALTLTACGGEAGDYPASIMVEDVLYYSTGTEMPAEIDPSAILGETTSYTDKMPTENGQVNFDRDLGAPYARVEDGIAVLIGNEWVLFQP